MNNIIVRNSDGNIVGVEQAKTLADAKFRGDQLYTPGYYVHIKTARGTTWIRRKDGWVHDTGRRG